MCCLGCAAGRVGRAPEGICGPGRLAGVCGRLRVAPATCVYVSVHVCGQVARAGHGKGKGSKHVRDVLACPFR